MNFVLQAKKEELKIPKIMKLSPHVADLIAAGEVVERPSSVVKELVENSIDSGAGLITVEIKNGGMTYIRVTDDGCGMSPEDAETSFLRHATSKLRDERGLEAIGTLGFRGEALAAISSVSHMELMTREAGTNEGTRVTVTAGEITGRAPAGCPEGTTMIVRDLFFNTPARLKFMKTDRSEGAAVTAAVLRCALSHPEVSVRYIKDGKEEYHTPGDGRTDSCVYSVFGREFASGLIEAGTEDEHVSVTGYVSSPSSSRGNRSSQYFFVNGRHVKSKTLQAALEQAYKNSLFTGKYPACVLYITVSPGAVDVNVHPAKTEVRFLNEKRVFDGVYYAALGALEKDSPHIEIKLSRGTEKSLSGAALKPDFAKPENESQKPDAVFAGTGQGNTENAPDVSKKAYSGTGHRLNTGCGSAGLDLYGLAEMRRPEGIKPGGALVRDGAYVPYGTSRLINIKSDIKKQELNEPKPDAETEMLKIQEKAEYRIIGEAMDTYIIVEKGDSLWLIDKHAAHERMHFDRLKDSGYQVMAQQLIMPVICSISPEDSAVLEENCELLDRLGFEIGSFGEDTAAIRRIPSDIDIADAGAALEEICEALRGGGAASNDDRIDRVLHTVACKAAIKAGRTTDLRELDGLVKKVMSGEVKYCPHGRPVAVELTKTSLDKSFKRI